MKSLKSLRRRCRVCGDIFDDSVPECPSDGGVLADLVKGLELFGPYEYVSVLGEGGMGIVYKARHKVIDKVVAIKMLRPGRLTSDDIRRFQKEGKAVSRLHHPGIVEVHDLGLTPQGLPYMVMDFINGTSLKDLIESHGALSLTVGVDVAHQIADAMNHAHQQGVIHRDLKSSNIMLVETGFETYQVKVVDFGIAKIDHADLNNAGHTLTTTGEIFGSPAYMSPEQARGEKVEAQTDIYSAGCIFFESLTGATPFHGGTVFDVLVRHLNDTPPTLEEASLGRKFPASVQHLVGSMLEKDPAKRPANFAAVCDSLAALQSGQFAIPEQNALSITGRLTKSIKARAPLAVVSVALFITIVVLAFISFKTFAMTEPKMEHAEDIDRIKSQVESQLRKSGKSLSTNDKNSSAFSVPMILPYDLGGPLKSAQTLVELSYRNDEGCAGLGDIQLSDEVLKYLSQQHKLMGLSLNNNQIGDRLFDYIKNLPLHKLNLSGTNVTDKGLRVAATMKTLDDIDLTRLNWKKEKECPTKGLSGEGLKALTNLPHLKTLRLAEDCLRDDDLQSLPSMKRLSELIVSGRQHLTPKACTYIGEIEDLTSLDMDALDIPLPAFSRMKNFPRLRKLFIGSNRAVRAEDLPEFLRKAKRLEELDLSGTPMTHACVHDLANCNELTTLVLTNCPKLSKSDVDYLKKKLAGCHIDSDSDLGSLKK